MSGTISSSAAIACAVPQGSILGPLLFLIYVKDMSGAVNHRLLLYADDSVILVADGKTILIIEISLPKELEVVSEWLVDNKLSLHLGKTESILFGSRSRLRSQSNLLISCKGTHIGSKEVVKYLCAVLELLHCV